MQGAMRESLRQLFQERGLQIAAALRDLEDRGNQFRACGALSNEPAGTRLQQAQRILLVRLHREDQDLILGSSEASILVTSIPSRPGIDRSITATSGKRVRASRIASSPSPVHRQFGYLDSLLVDAERPR